MESTLKFQRGDIYFVRLDNRTGSEQSGTRPAVILQNDVGNSCSPTLIVATLTSKTEKKATQPDALSGGAGGAGAVHRSG